ncbi:MAG: hypothetical protein NT027_15470, partial [Proteobacteria bacterium]|nr:hypothetical protein [Pseudomonadota bacterium]
MPQLCSIHLNAQGFKMPSADSHNKTLITDLSNPESILSFNSLGVLLIFFFSMIQFHWTQFQSGLDLTPGDLGDPRFVNIILEHGYQWLIGESNTSFWSPEWNFYPQQHTLTQSEVMIGSMISYAPFRLIGINPFASFQYFIITCSILNFVAAFLLARSLKISSIGSALAASIFAYGLCRSGFTPHPQLLAHWWTPLGIYLGIKSLHLSTKNESSDIKLKKFYFFSKSNTFAAFAGICFSLQFWSAFYLGFFCAIAAIAIGSFLLLFQFNSTINHIKKYYIQGLVFLFAAGMTLSPLAFAYFETARNFGTRPDYVVIQSMPKIVAWLTPTTSSLFYSWLYKLNEGAHNNHMEFSIFQGTIPTFCFIIGIAYCLRNRKNTNPLIYNCIFTMAAIFLFFTRIGQDTI